MKRAAGAVLFLMRAGAFGTGVLGSNEWTHDALIGDASSKRIEVAREKLEYSGHLEHRLTTDTTAITRTGETGDRNLHQKRKSGNDDHLDKWNVNEKNKRTTHHHHEGSLTERTHSDPQQVPRSSDVNTTGKWHSHHTRDGIITSECRNGIKCNHNGHDGNDTTFDSRTHSHMEQHHNRQSSNKKSIHLSPKERTGKEEEAAVPAKTESNFINALFRLSSEERIEGEEAAVQAKTTAHPIGLINALGGQATIRGRPMDLDSREVATNTTIILSLSGFALLLLVLLCCAARLSQKRRREKDSTQRLHNVFRYLTKFNMDDIDIQVSATGGYHVGYIAELSQGINTREQLDQKTDASSDDSESGSCLSIRI